MQNEKFLSYQNTFLFNQSKFVCDGSMTISAWKPEPRTITTHDTRDVPPLPEFCPPIQLPLKNSHLDNYTLGNYPQ